MTSNVINFYNGKTVFITGATGFVGVSLIEKLLRTVPDLKNIYVLIRPKKEKGLQERLEDLKKNSVFNRLREENKTDLFNKLIPVAGDIGQENLGLSSEDRLTIVEVVQVVFHSAATLDFGTGLKESTIINLLGTRRVVQLCQEIRDLKALVHVSSAYVNSTLNEVQERVYPAPYDVDELLKLTEKWDDATIEAETSNIIKDHPNSYTFTKHLAEHEVKNGNIPAAIVRPSMITAAWKEPVPGWTISKNGPQGFLMGASKGVVRRLPVAKYLIYDYIPVDIVVNALIVAAYAQDGNKELKIYHCTSSTCNPFRWVSVEDKINNYLHSYPLKSAVWYPHLKLLPSIFWYRISAIFVHFLPAYILDTVTKLSGGRPILVRLHTNVNNSLDRLKIFIFTEWKFYNTRLIDLHKSLSETDTQLFNLDIKPLVWEEYFVTLTQGVRQYLCNESPKTLPKARSKDTILLFAHLGLQASVLGLVWWLFKVICASTWTKTGITEMASDVPSVSEWFHGRNVFVTGGTGFMGKVLIYKLLLSCHDLGNIFMLIRKKKDVDPQTRLQVILQQEPFKMIKEKHPERLKKIILISGETTSEGLALSADDKQRLLKEVSVVFHAAASVRFDLSLKEAITTNTIGTKNVLNFAKQLPHLESFVHISTSYCHCNEPVLEERSYPCLAEPEKVIEMVNSLTDSELNAVTSKLLQGLPNTYAFSKALCEELVEKSGLPAGIARPSIVVASWKEPAPGWIENMNGPTGLMIGAGKGVIRTLLCNYDYLLNLIPCDMAINAIIGLAWKVGKDKIKKPIFMNVTSGSENPISWGYAVDTGKKYATTYPFTGLLWYPGGSLTTLWLYHWFRVIFFHFVPAYFLDAMIVLSGKKPFLVRVQHRVNVGIEMVQYYTMNQWEFRNDKMKELQNELNPSDREEFFMNTKAISWDDYLCKYIQGTRQYCLKDDPSTLPRARKVLRYLYFADWIVKIGLTIFFAWLIYSWLSPSVEFITTVQSRQSMNVL